MKTIKQRYFDLENDVFTRLKDRVNASRDTSRHINGNALQVNICDYEELVIINEDLMFIDRFGTYYNVLSECTLLDLINIIYGTSS